MGAHLENSKHSTCYTFTFSSNSSENVSLFSQFNNEAVTVIISYLTHKLRTSEATKKRNIEDNLFLHWKSFLSVQLFFPFSPFRSSTHTCLLALKVSRQGLSEVRHWHRHAQSLMLRGVQRECFGMSRPVQPSEDGTLLFSSMAALIAGHRISQDLVRNNLSSTWAEVMSHRNLQSRFTKIQLRTEKFLMWF